MNNMFTPQQDALVFRLKELQKQANELIHQRKEVKRDKVLRESYSISIVRLLGAIQRISDEIAKEKPTDGNQ